MMEITALPSSEYRAYVVCSQVAACWATGFQQDVPAPEYIWLWWGPAFTWTLTAIRTAMGERG